MLMGGFDLIRPVPFRYNGLQHGGVNDGHLISSGKGLTMKSFYYNSWLPFIDTKRRILLLAIASYLALC